MIEVLLADDHKIIMDGLKVILAQDKEVNIVGDVGNGKEVLTFLENNTVDVIVMDINMPEMDGLEATKIIKKRFPKIKILILSMLCDAFFVPELIKAGVNGYVMKNRGQEELIRAIRSVSKGVDYFGDEIAGTLVNIIRNPSKELEDEPVRLTRRERDVLKYFAQGYSTKEISGKLAISNSTVESHKRNLVSKTGVSNSKGLIKYAISQGLLN